MIYHLAQMGNGEGRGKNCLCPSIFLHFPHLSQTRSTYLLCGRLAGFHKALGMVGAEFLDRVDFYQNSWLPARVVVEGAVQMRKQVDPSGEVVVFSQGGCPWKEHLFSLEKELSVDTSIKFVLYPDQNGQWRVQCWEGPVFSRPTTHLHLPLPYIHHQKAHLAHVKWLPTPYIVRTFYSLLYIYWSLNV
uniref:Uncharacterized protein n=1 Tax=Hucho hucho TaxID=62062 RepID=A0A4W5JWX6_9TELE